MAKATDRPAVTGVQGWREFQSERSNLLAEFALAETRASSRPTKTEPGDVAEAVFRQWLGGFLPGRYGVTSGHIISTGRSDAEKITHFDVIIYDKLESPVLWRATNPDQSIQGHRLAIPSEHVLAVFEVKSTFTTEVTTEVRDKLLELGPLLLDSNSNNADPLVRPFLPDGFFCGAVFFRIDAEAGYSQVGLPHLAEVEKMFQHRRIGWNVTGTVLSSPDEAAANMAANLEVLSFENPIDGTVGSGRGTKRGQSLLNAGVLCKSAPIGDRHVSAGLDWSDNAFAMFANNLVARLRGMYVPGALSSINGMRVVNPPESGHPAFPLDTVRETKPAKKRIKASGTKP